jgi:YegS/Rv2252/BmrU family lipid kinase
MRRVALIYNPASGQSPGRRAQLISRVQAVFEQAGIGVRAIATTEPGSAGVLAQQAVQSGCDTVIACGGDGTAHEVLQGIIGTSATLGVIPLGTANALACDLGLPRSPIKAARSLLTAQPMRVPAGHVTFQNKLGQPDSRYFIVAVGVGADALFFSRLDSRMKQRFGYAVYLVEAFRLAFTHHFPLFAAEFTEAAEQAPHREMLSELLTVRIGNFGGLLRNLAPGAALNNPRLSVIAVRTRSRMRLLQFMLAVICRRPAYSRHVALFSPVAVECSNPEGAEEKHFVEADGEFLGTLPARIELADATVNLLVPAENPLLAAGNKPKQP